MEDLAEMYSKQVAWECWERSFTASGLVYSLFRAGLRPFFISCFLFRPALHLGNQLQLTGTEDCPGGVARPYRWEGFRESDSRRYSLGPSTTGLSQEHPGRFSSLTQEALQTAKRRMVVWDRGASL